MCLCERQEFRDLTLVKLFIMFSYCHPEIAMVTASSHRGLLSSVQLII